MFQISFVFLKPRTDMARTRPRVFFCSQTHWLVATSTQPSLIDRLFVSSSSQSGTVETVFEAQQRKEREKRAAKRKARKAEIKARKQNAKSALDEAKERADASSGEA